MPERINAEQFWSEQLEVLGRDEIAFHGMLFAGVYSSDKKVHDEARQGIDFQPSAPFYDVVANMADRRVTIQWLRVMPDAGERGYNDKDIDAMHRTMGAVARTGIDVRTIRLSQHAERLERFCGTESPILQEYMGAIRNPEQGSRRSFWATYRQHMGVLAVAYVGLMDYEGERFLGHEPYHLPLEPHVKNWVRFWRNIYLDYGEPVEGGSEG